MERNAFGQPVGRALPGWQPRPRPTAPLLEGRWCRLERLSAERHAAALFAADRQDTRGESWTYLPYGPFADLAAYTAWAQWAAAGEDPCFYAVVDAATGAPAGVASLLRVIPEMGSIEVGHLHFSPLLQRTRAATEAHFLLMAHVFDDLGYRRYEWKCDALNAPSRAAAQRLGFRYEGTFLQASVVRGRNRDTAWFAITDGEWPAVRDRLAAWLDPGNFDADGVQRAPLRAPA